MTYQAEIRNIQIEAKNILELSDNDFVEYCIKQYFSTLELNFFV